MIISTINYYVPIRELKKYLLQKTVVYCQLSFYLGADEIPFFIRFLSCGRPGVSMTQSPTRNHPLLKNCKPS